MIKFRSFFIFLIILGLACAHSGCTQESRVNQRVTAAEKSYRAGRYEEAEIESKNVLQLDSLNNQAIAILGLTYAQQGRVGASLPFLIRAREQLPENLDVALQLALADLALGKLEDAEKLAHFVLSKRPADLQAPLILADTARTPAAIASAQQDLRSLTSPANRAVVETAKGLLELRLKNTAAAKSNFDAALAADSKSSDAYAGLSLYYISTGKREEGTDAFAHSAENAVPRSPRRIQYSQFLIQRGDLAAARTFLNGTLKAAPDYMPAILILAQVDLAEKKYDAAQAGLTEALRRDPSNLDATLLDAQLKFTRGQNEPAIAELEKISSFYPNAPALNYQLGVGYDAIGQTGKALVSVNRALKADPEYLAAALLQARLQTKQGGAAVAISSLEKWVQRRPEAFEAWLLLAETLLRQGDFVRTLTVTKSAEDKFPGQVPLRFIQARANIGAGKIDAARADLAAIRTQAPGFFPAVELLFNLELSQQRVDVAKQIALGEVRDHPEQVLNVVLLAKAYTAENDFERSEKTLNDGLAAHPDSLELLYSAADLQVSTHHPEQAQSLLERIVAQRPSDPLPLMRLGMLQEQRGQYDKARANYEKILTINPNFSSALNNLAYLYSERFNEPDRALAAAEKARLLLPSDPNTADTLGWILVAKRQLVRGRSLLQESAAQLGSSPEVMYHLGVADYLLGDEAEADRLLSAALAAPGNWTWRQDGERRLKVLRLKPEVLTETDAATLRGALSVEGDDAPAAGRLAAFYLAHDQSSKAIEVLERVLRTNPANGTLAAMLAREYLKAAQPAKALEVAKLAHDALPSNGEVTYLLGWSAFLQGNATWAATLLDEADAALPNNAEVLFRSAVAKYAVGRGSDALDDAERAAKIANPALKTRINEFVSSLQFNESTSNSSIRPMTGGRDEKVPELELVSAMAQAKQSERVGDSAQAISAYAALSARFPDFPQAKRQLIILYARDPKLSREALALAPKVRAAFPGDKVLAAAIGTAAFQSGDFKSAETEFTRSELSTKENVFHLGLAELKNGNTAPGRRHLSRAIELGLAGADLVEAQAALSAPSVGVK